MLRHVLRNRGAGHDVEPMEHPVHYLHKRSGEAHETRLRHGNEGVHWVLGVAPLDEANLEPRHGLVKAVTLRDELPAQPLLLRGRGSSIHESFDEVLQHVP